MEELGKLIRELFDDLKRENATLKAKYALLEKRNQELSDALDKVKGLVVNHITLSSQDDNYISSFWNDDAKAMFDALGIGKEHE